MTYQQIAADVLAKCAANDPWFPKPSVSVALAWAEHFERHQLERADLLEAVRQFYDTTEAGDRISPAAILRLARTMRRDRMARAEAVLELDGKVPMPAEIREQIKALAASKAVPDA